MSTAYLNFLKESLEIEDFIRPRGETAEAAAQRSVASAAATTATASASAAPLSFFIRSAEEPSAEALELLGKMTQAMGQSLDQVNLVIVDGAEVEPHSSVAVLFTDDEFSSLGEWRKISDCDLMTTYSPEVLLAQPALKKAAWVHLQKVMARLKNYQNKNR